MLNFRRESGELRAGPVVAVVMVTLAVFRLWQPVGGDQVLGMLIGERLRDGDVLYRDVWDIRQPFTFYWHATIGSLFGTSVLSLRIGQLLWQGALALIISRDVQSRGCSRREAIVTACACVGPLFLMTRGTDVASPDSLALLPLYAAFRLVAMPGRNPLRARPAIALGALAVVAGLFKILYAPLPFLFAVAWVLLTHAGWRAALRGLAWFSGTVAACALVVVVYFVHANTWDWVVHTWFVQGPAMSELSPAPVSRLVRGVGRFVLLLAPLVVAAAVTVWRFRRPSIPLWSALALAWLAVDIPILLAQQWWPYQLSALVVPLGLLAAPTFASITGNRRTLIVAVVVCVGLGAASDTAYLKAVARHGLDRTAIAHDLTPASVDRDAARRFLESDGAAPGDVYVFGDPTMLLDLGREQRLAIHGWSPEFLDTTTWNRLTDDFIDRPPTYVFADPFSFELVRDRAPALFSWLTTRYDEVTILGSIKVLQLRDQG